jgi:Signal transduction histidine kinase
MNEYSKTDELFLGENISCNFNEKNKYMKIFEALPCPVILLDKDNNIIDTNYKASCAFKNVDLKGEFEKLNSQIIGRLKLDQDDTEELVFEREIQTEQGLRYFEIKVTPIFSVQNNFSGSILVLNDFTAHKLLEEKLKKEKSEAEGISLNKSKFFASVSHEIRTAINGIIGMTDLTLMTELNIEQKENLNLVKSSGLKLLTIINSILDFSNIQLEKIKLESVEFNFKELINEIIRDNSLRALENKLEFKSKIDENIPELLIGDPIKTKQILNNLLDNAINFTRCGTVSLSISKEETADKKINLKICVKDTGVGIDKKDISKLFKGYSKIDNKNSIKKHRGTGLGLSICKGFIEMMGGKIEVKSRKDVGTSFSFNIILERGKKYNVMDIIDGKDKNIPNLKINRRLNILIVEDDKASQMVIYNLFRKNGHISDIANNGREALRMIENKNYDLILMDIQMPVMDGIETTKIIRKSEENADKHIPIIALTAYALKGDREKLLGVGMDSYISKPFNVQDLLQTVYSSVKDDAIKVNNNKPNNMDGEALVLYLL